MWLKRLYDRFRDLVHELSKFGIVGGAAYVVDTALFALLLVSMESLTAKTIAAAVATTIAFVGNRFWTWRHRARSGLVREYVLYFTLNAVGLAISLVVLGISHYGLGEIWPALQTSLADVIAANVVGLAAGTGFRFWSYRRFVFRDLADADGGDGGGTGDARKARGVGQAGEAGDAGAGRRAATADAYGGLAPATPNQHGNVA